MGKTSRQLRLENNNSVNGAIVHFAKDGKSGILKKP